LLELESDNESVFKELLSEITGLGLGFDFFYFFFLFFLESLQVFEEYWEGVVSLLEILQTGFEIGAEIYSCCLPLFLYKGFDRVSLSKSKSYRKAGLPGFELIIY
jgi:hypothetical protein